MNGNVFAEYLGGKFLCWISSNYLVVKDFLMLVYNFSKRKGAFSVLGFQELGGYIDSRLYISWQMKWLIIFILNQMALKMNSLKEKS